MYLHANVIQLNVKTKDFRFFLCLCGEKSISLHPEWEIEAIRGVPKVEKNVLIIYAPERAERSEATTEGED